MTNSIYNFKINSLQGNQIDFANFEGKVILIVNTASACGLTPQYAGLQELYDQYSDKGLVVIGFPCNQFGGQEPGTPQQIQDGCLVNYGVKFIMTQKVDVNGDSTHPIFEYLKNALPGIMGLKDLKWNFTKFLIDRSGQPYRRFAPTDEPNSMIGDIEELLKR